MKHFLIITLLLASCSMAPKQPAVHDFGIVKPVPVRRAGEQTIIVDAPKWLWDKGIRYRLLYKSATQVNVYALDRWIAAPPKLFEQLLITSGENLDYSMTVNMLEFEQQFTAADQSKVVLRFSVEASSKLKHSRKEFYLQQPTKTPDAKGAVSGFAQLVREAIDKINDWLSHL